MCSGAENSNGLKWRENYWSDYEYFDLENDTRHPIHFVCSLFCPKNNKMAFVLFQCQQQGCQKWQQLKKATTKLQLQKVDQNLLPKSWPKFSFKILTKIQLQNFNQASATVRDEVMKTSTGSVEGIYASIYWKSGDLVRWHRCLTDSLNDRLWKIELLSSLEVGVELFVTQFTLKYRPNITLKVLTKSQASLDQNSTWESWPNFSFNIFTEIQVQII